jgi:hypothetical protein
VGGQGGYGESTEAKLGLEGGPLRASKGNSSLEKGYGLIEGDGRDVIVCEAERTRCMITAEEVGEGEELLGLADEVLARREGLGFAKALR